ncbi:flavodoxin [Cetobacterium sp.]|uniref:flavodoxin n=1 Tax=Cetobacterium sp. TaxID=2071632 RepID=UPI002FC95B9E
MKQIGIFYSSSRGKSEFTAQMIKDLLKEKCELFKITDNVDKINNFDKLIFIIPTYGAGIPQEDWIKNLEKISQINFSNKTIGFIGRGNQGFFAATFIDGIRPIYDIVIEKGAKVVGFTNTEGYSFVKSKAIIDNKFIGLALDELFMYQEIKEKLENWLEQIQI